MLKFIVRRLLQSIPTFLGITVLSYIIMVLAPGDPASLMAFGPNTSPEEKEALAQRLGTNDPLPLQYVRWLIGDDWMVVEELHWYQFALEDGTQIWLSQRQASIDDETGEITLLASRQPYRLEPNETAEVAGRVGRREPLELLTEQVEQIHGDNYGILRGDFGSSFRYKENPLALIGERLPATIELNVGVIVLGLAGGIVIGVLAAVRRGHWFDTSSRVLVVLGDSIPIFWLAILLIMIFAAPGLGLFPMGSRCAQERGGCPPVYDRLEYLVLPTTALVIGTIAFFARYMRSSMLENVNSDYVRTALAKGLSERTVWFRHTLRNALIPIVTFLGPTIVSLLSGAVIIETIFAWPGVGRLYYQAVVGQDYPVVMASVVIGSILTILGYLISDILYVVIDPRIRLN